MTVSGNLEVFAGKPVVDFKTAGDIGDFSRVAPRLRCEYDSDDSLQDLLATMLKADGVAATSALVFGLWSESGETYEVRPTTAVELLIAEKDKLPAIDALFFGDIISEENEISWIEQTDYGAMWGAFPRLSQFWVRGGNGLRLGRIDHEHLDTLVIQTGGMSRALLHEALAVNAPIRHLELWLGAEDYGADSSVEDFSDLFGDKLFPKLETLGLRNSEYSDAIAQALVAAPLLDRIKTLDLSMGTLTDAGAKALAESGRLGKLEKLDISHHYVSPEGVALLRRATPNLVADDAEEVDEWDGEKHYYVAVGE
ncbi:STM4015 family protein [Sphingomonas sp. ASY06-1R]|uniref:STM4015 family protein n=1 Tax=Sphingomonas sp. ASY06-1R TaxID=3445771 RepID=UPI003FA2528D